MHNEVVWPKAVRKPVKEARASTHLGPIAQAAVQLGALGPRLANVAAEMESHAEAQARAAGVVAETAEALVRELDRAMSELGISSGQVGKALATVKRIADHTRLLSVNASIEAARAGVSGRAFAVVVDEVKQLSEDTSRTTRDIDLHMEAMQASVARVSGLTGRGGAAKAEFETTVEAVTQQVRSMAQSARKQREEASTLHLLGGQVRTLTESLLFGVGRFRFEAHERARLALEDLIPELDGILGERAACETVLKEWLETRSYFELVYVTDAAGRQFVDNIARVDGRTRADPAGYGRDWSSRPWYREARMSDGVRATDIYRSTATGDYCFTVAASLHGEGGEIAGVVAADVNFQKLILAAEEG